MTAEVAGPFDSSSRACPRPSSTSTTSGRPRARIVSELATRHPGTVPSDLDELRRFYEFRDFAHFIEVYLAVVALIRTPEDIHYLTYEVAREMATEQGLRYAELTCTPYTSVRPDQPDAGHADRGLHRGHRGRPGRGRARLRAGAALDLRHPRRVRGAVGRRDPGLRAEPPARGAGRLRARWPGGRACRGRSSSRTSSAARAAGLHSVPHAGETTGPQTVWDALTPPAGRADRARHVGGPGPGAAAGTSPRRGSRSRSARRPTSPPGRSPPWRSTRSGRSGTPG